MGWSSTLKGTKVNNHPASFANKAELRRRLLEQVGGGVFDAFAGAGRMFREVWKHAPDYVGCDLAWYPDTRLAYVADNRRVLRAIDLARFAIFDLDAYGSPWEQALIIAARRRVAPGERIGFALTDGSKINLRLGGMPVALRTICGFRSVVAGAGRLQDEITDLAIAGLARLMRCQIAHRWEARGSSGARVIYTGLVLVGEQ